MARPTEGPGWATDVNFGAGARPWNGQPNKTLPSAGRQAEGFTPENPLAADELNWILNNHGLWLIDLDTLVSLALFGSGRDGSAILDGVNTVPWASKVGSVYTLNGLEPQLVDLTIDGATLVFNGRRLYGQGTLTTLNGGKLHSNGGAGGNASGGTPGAAGVGTASAFLPGSGNGGEGGTVAGGANGESRNNPNADALRNTGGNGGNGNMPGNPGGSGGVTGGLGGALYDPTLFLSPALYHSMARRDTAAPDSDAVTLRAIQGGSGGGGGGGNIGPGDAGGGGGAGGGPACVAFRNLNLANASDITCAGGAGGAGAAASATGGGGGGGGGSLTLIYYSKATGLVFSNATNCPGGAAGAGGTGGNAGAVGLVGTLYERNLSDVVGGTTIATTAHEESGNIAVNTVDTSVTINFANPFGAAPPTVGGYKFQISIARTDGVLGAPAYVITGLTVNDITVTLIDSFQGVLSWRAWV